MSYRDYENPEYYKFERDQLQSERTWLGLAVLALAGAFVYTSSKKATAKPANYGVLTQERQDAYEKGMASDNAEVVEQLAKAFEDAGLNTQAFNLLGHAGMLRVEQSAGK